MVRSGRTRPAHARSSGSETLLRIQSLAGYIIGTLKSRWFFRSLRAFPMPALKPIDALRRGARATPTC